MKTNHFNCGMLLLIGWLLPAASAQAFDPGEAAGMWRVLNLSVPSQLTLERNAQGVVTNIPEATYFEQSTGTLTVLSNGTFSGTVPDPVSGTIAGGDQGEVILQFTGPRSPMTFHLNRTADFLTTCGSFSQDYLDLIVALRSPTTLTTNDLAGQWNALALATPDQLVLNRDSSNRVINLDGLGDFETYGGTLTINTDGTISGNIDGVFTGVVASASSGVVDLTVMDDEGSFPVSLFVNAGKDVMAFVESRLDAQDNFQQIMIFQKASTTDPVSQLAGHWRVMTFDTPQLTPQYNGQGQLIALDGNDNFSAGRGSLVSGYDGFFTAQVEGPATGTLSPATNGLLVANVVTGEGPETLGFQLNTSQTLLGSSRYQGDGWEMVLVTESAPVPGPAQNFGLMMLPAANGFTLNWATATNSVLQTSSNLTTWDTLSATLGQHSYTTGNTNNGACFRVTQPAP